MSCLLTHIIQKEMEKVGEDSYTITDYHEPNKAEIKVGSHQLCFIYGLSVITRDKLEVKLSSIIEEVVYNSDNCYPKGTEASLRYESDLVSVHHGNVKIQANVPCLIKYVMVSY